MFNNIYEEFFSLTIVVPETCTDIFRFTIESLFITYTETNLNMIGNVLNPQQLPEYNPWLIRGDEWCHGLLRRPQPKQITSTEMVTTKKINI